MGSDRWLAVPGDLTEANVGGVVAEAVTSHWGRIDVLLHLVGGWAGGTAVVDLDPDEVRRMVDQHLWTTFHVLQSVVPGMVERGFGRVIAVSSPLAVDPGAKGGATRSRRRPRRRSFGPSRARCGIRRHREPRDRPHDRCEARA